MNSSSSNSDNSEVTGQAAKAGKSAKPPKKKGPIRFEAIIPISIIIAAVILYVHFFFDHHLKKAIEWGGYQAIGAEVNVESVKTSFLGGKFQLKGLEITNAERPTHNAIKIGDIRFGFLWDALLRARLVIEEMAVEQVEIDSRRSHPGKVKPPEPVKQEDNKPSVIETEGKKLKDEALKKTQSKYQGNVLGDLAKIVGGGNIGDSAQMNMKEIENNLPSKVRIKELETEFQKKQKEWDAKLKSLPKGPEIQALGDRLGKVKIKGFSNPQEVADSVKQIDQIIKEADQKVKLVQSTGGDLSNDLKAWDKSFKELDAMVKKDIADLEKRFSIPKIDAASLSKAVFQNYMNQYMAQIEHYRAMAQKYVPPNIMKKEKKEPDLSFQPRPRAKGVSYEFGRQNAYPAFWIKKISVSSKAIPQSNIGDLSGKITDVTSNQVIIGRPTVGEFKGQFPGLEISDFRSKVTVNNLGENSLITAASTVGSYGVDAKQLVESPDVKIGFSKAVGEVKNMSFELKGLKEFKMGLNTSFKQVNYDVSAKNEVLDSILKNVFKELPVIGLTANVTGTLPSDIDTDVESNLGSELQKGLEKQVKAKIEEARKRLEAMINEAIGKEKSKLEAEFNKVKGQLDSEVKKVNDQINAQKVAGEQKINAAKKDAENSAKKQLEGEGQKKLDELKKRLGF